MIRLLTAALLTVPPVAVDPGTLAITTGQCNGGDLTVRLTNTSDEPVYADATLDAPAALHLPRSLISTWLPPGYTSDVPVAVTAATGTPPGTYHVRVRGRGRAVDVPVEVTAPPPGAGLLALASRVTASSARAGSPACAAIDGRLDTMWNDTTGRRWPDRWQLDWQSPHRIGEVEVTTTADRGLRDWDVQVAAAAGWVTVASVRGNSATRTVSAFTPRTTDAVRVVTLAANGVNDQSRLVEVVIR
ncbi:discoidin domain-containing protein [Actinoplanes siamensis]|uniref:F5/8 type C domain-containing protein n=1 Tax=Actinoplanes siamensis TaxID=1223317 RepID=A0A919N3P9_9ACTN|nr:discoidin domain-containing protein [Actinoplanes siamensis]GIF03815.1 hypothetical protein Asi03nite_13530 [Actinoplanes siamensis]